MMASSTSDAAVVSRAATGQTSADHSRENGPASRRLFGMPIPLAETRAERGT